MVSDFQEGRRVGCPSWRDPYRQVIKSVWQTLKVREPCMDKDRKGLGIILHSGSYDRIYHGLSIALTALALGRRVKLFFTYWALEYLRRDTSPTVSLDKEGEHYQRVIEDYIEKGQ